jgi:hypothetical protein
MGLKGYRLWAMGQLDSNVQSPTAEMPPDGVKTRTLIDSFPDMCRLADSYAAG